MSINNPNNWEINPENSEFSGKIAENLSDQRCRSDRFCLQEDINALQNNEFFVSDESIESLFFRSRNDSGKDVPKTLEEFIKQTQEESEWLTGVYKNLENGEHYLSSQFLDSFFEDFTDLSNTDMPNFKEVWTLIYEFLIDILSQLSLEDIYYISVVPVQIVQEMNRDPEFENFDKETSIKEFSKRLKTTEWRGRMEKIKSKILHIAEDFDALITEQVGTEKYEQAMQELDHYTSRLEFDFLDELSRTSYPKNLQDNTFELQSSGITFSYQSIDDSPELENILSIDNSYTYYRESSKNDWVTDETETQELLQSHMKNFTDFESLEFIEYPSQDGKGKFVGIKSGEHEIISYLD